MAGIQTRTQRVVRRSGARAGATRAPRVRNSTRRTLKAIPAALGILLVGASFAPGAQARTSCSYLGAPANVLNVVVRDEGAADEGADAEIRRKGQEIIVNEFLERPQPCAGGTPTVLTTDTINVLLLGDLAFADVRLGGGPFAPGATPETMGAPEIEIRVTGEGAHATVVGTSRADEFHWGPGGTNAGLNLNPRSVGDRDVDVTVADRGSFLIAEGGAGNDTIIGQPGARIPDSAFSKGGRGDDLLRAPRSGAILQGGPGNDKIAGAGWYDLIDGGPGNDRVTGGGGADEITGGPGKDRLFGGAGRDFINSRDSARDTVRCGPGKDRATADRRDRVRGCERIRGR